MNIRNFEDHIPRIAESAFVDPAAVVIGDVVIGSESSIWPGTVVRGDEHSVRIGERSNLQDGTVVHVTHDGPFTPGGHPTLIGDGVTIGHRAVIHACTIENDCLIGMNAVVLDGATVRSNVIVGAGTVVGPGKVLESGYLWLGVPARRIRPLTDAEQESLRYSGRHYVQLKNRHQASLATAQAGTGRQS